MKTTVTMSDEFKKRLYPRLPKIADEFGTAVNVLDEVGIKQSLSDFIDGAKKAGVEGYKQFFAVKATPFPYVLRKVNEAGGGFDCSSITEVLLAREAGALPEDIMFTSNNTTTEEFEVAMSEGGCIMNLDDISFLDHPNFQDKVPETMCFRINPGSLRQDDSVIGIPEEAKYGIMVSEIEEAYTRARAMGVKHFGMHTMICSNDLDYKNLIKTTKMLMGFVKDLNKATGIKINFINLGGGIGIPYKHEDKPFELKKLWNQIAELQADYETNTGEKLNIYTECGRAITGLHGVLVNRAINRKQIYQEHIGVQCAMPALMRPAMYGAYHHIEVVDFLGRLIDSDFAPCRKVSVVGPICENCDRLATGRLLPVIKVGEKDGDFIIVHCTGAHSTAMGFNYNGRTRPGTIMLKEDGDIVWVEMPETITDLLARTRSL